MSAHLSAQDGLRAAEGQRDKSRQAKRWQASAFPKPERTLKRQVAPSKALASQRTLKRQVAPSKALASQRTPKAGAHS
ncbi:MAG: hypothetical protein HZC36_13535 [Armatimonadetes bacterium]|nr:hypothetical protein [Armatimonadota bacterium]